MSAVVVTTKTPSSTELAAQIVEHDKLKASLISDLDVLDRSIMASLTRDPKAATDLSHQAAGLQERIRTAELVSASLSQAHWQAQMRELTAEFYRLFDEWGPAFTEAAQMFTPLAKRQNLLIEEEGRLKLTRLALRDRMNSLGHFRELRTQPTRWEQLYAEIDRIATKVIEDEKHYEAERAALVVEESKVRELWRFVDMHQSQMIAIADQILEIGGVPPRPLWNGEVPTFLTRPAI